MKRWTRALELVLMGLVLWGLGQSWGCTAPSDPEKSAADGGDAGLKWYTTCGDPVCRGHTAQQGVTTCASQKEGETCSTDGEKCDPNNDCNSLLLCTKSDPKQQTGGCPISTRRLKRDIRYLDAQQQQAFHKALMAFRLATYHYRFDKDKSRRRLGFIIEDQPKSPAVDRKRSMVDLYQYTSMVVASMQVQSRLLRQQSEEIKLLRKQLAAMQKQMKRLQGAKK